MTTGGEENQARRIASPRVLIADQDPDYRSSLRTLLTSAGIDVSGEAIRGDEAVSLAAVLEPDVVLLELSLDGLDGMATAQQIRAANPRVEIIVLTTYERATLHETPGVGLYLYAIVLKDGPPDDSLLEMVRQAWEHSHAHG